MAADVGGISATASPIANSSGSVTNQAIQVLQGPYITNTYGNGVQCQGATMNITPYITGTGSFKRPFEHTYMDPVYDVHDADDDGQIDNPGNILYYVPTRTGQQDGYNLSAGLSATWSRPLDKKAQKLCIEAATAQVAYQQQLTSNKRLDFELARMKNGRIGIIVSEKYIPKSYQKSAERLYADRPDEIPYERGAIWASRVVGMTEAALESCVENEDKYINEYFKGIL